MNFSVMKKQSIANIAYYMAGKLNDGENLMSESMKRNLCQGGYYKNETDVFSAAYLYDQLYMLNYRSRKIRYNEQFDYEEWGKIPDKKTLKPVSDIQVKKSLDYFLDQCDIERSAFYIGVVEFRDWLANQIVNGLPEYNSAGWEE